MLFRSDERFTPGHRCKNKRLYSLCIVEDDEDNLDREEEINVVEQESLIPHISLNALDGTRGCHTLRVTGRADQHSVYILIDFGSTHNFLNSVTANKLQCLATPIRTLVVETENGGTMCCYPNFDPPFNKIFKKSKNSEKTTKIQKNMFLLYLQCF